MLGGAHFVDFATDTPTRINTNPFTWSWFEVPLEDVENGTSVFYNAVVQVDSESLLTVAGQDEWANFDVMLVNGTLPGNAQTGEPGPVGNGNPYCWINEECESEHVLTFTERPRVTASFGYNASAPGGMTYQPLSHLVVGVREAGGSSGAVDYTITITRLPRILTDGLVIESALAPCTGVDFGSCRQFFTVPVTGFDIVHIGLQRTGENMTFVDSGGATRSNFGRGLVGDLFVAKGDSYDMMGGGPPVVYDERRVITNVTSDVEIGYFCTLQEAAGFYTVAIIAEDGGNGFGDECKDVESVNAETGETDIAMVGQCSDAEKELLTGIPRQGRGRFTLTVRHTQYMDGEMSNPDDTRAGCVGFGQTRNYTLTSQGMGDSQLYAEVTGGNVSLVRARCLGCDAGWVEAKPPIQALSASPCQSRNGTIWELQIILDAMVPATLAGFGPAEFVLTTRLMNSTLIPGQRVLPLSQGGRGYICCGAVVSYIIPDVPYTHAAAFHLNLTQGHVRAAFLKYEECVAPNVDVNGAVCIGQCEITWLTVYDEFYGAMEHTQSRSLSIPFGPTPWLYDPRTTKRRAGDWYLSIWALPGMSAEYQMDIEVVEHPRAPAVFSWSRFDGPFAPRDHYHFGLGGGEPESELIVSDGTDVDLQSMASRISPPPAPSSASHSAAPMLGGGLAMGVALLAALGVVCLQPRRREGR